MSQKLSDRLSPEPAPFPVFAVQSLRIVQFQEDFRAANFIEFSVFSSVFTVLSVVKSCLYLRPSAGIPFRLRGMRRSSLNPAGRFYSSKAPVTV
jgi:hypothetical protein